jgi:hypothetical protein
MSPSWSAAPEPRFAYVPPSGNKGSIGATFGRKVAITRTRREFWSESLHVHLGRVAQPISKRRSGHGVLRTRVLDMPTSTDS